MESPASDSRARAVGRYALYGQIAAGGVGTVHLARQRGAVGFARTVVIKRLRAQFAEDPDFVGMFVDEARLAARVHHPNVVTTLDVVAAEGEVFLVMEYIKGESLSKLLKASNQKSQRVDPRVVATVMAGVLYGLHAAHTATTEEGAPLNIVHRDVSPQNVLVSVDGVARVLDFGVAKAATRAQTTQDGQLKGKLNYMAPEQLLGQPVSPKTDIYAAALVLWEALTLKRPFPADNEGGLMAAVLKGDVPAPSKIVPELSAEFDKVVARGLATDPNSRYASAREMALDLERCAGIASPSAVGAWVEGLAGPALQARARLVLEIERSSALHVSSAPTEVELEGERTLTATPSRPSGKRAKVDVPPSQRSDYSNIAMTPATITERRGRPGGALGVVAMVGVALIAIAAGAMGVLRARHPPTPPLGAQPSVPLPSSFPPPSSFSPPASATPAPSESGPAAPASVAEVASVNDAAAAPSAVIGPRRGKAAGPKPTSQAECNPPYYFDDEGHKHFKDSCFH